MPVTLEQSTKVLIVILGWDIVDTKIIYTEAVSWLAYYSLLLLDFYPAPYLSPF